MKRSEGHENNLCGCGSVLEPISRRLLASNGNAPFKTAQGEKRDLFIS